MAGLMHDVGRLAMLIEFPAQADALLGTGAADDSCGVGDEIERFGFDHAQVGRALLQLWGLPPGIVQAAHQHADESEPADAFCASVWQANRTSQAMIGEPADQDVEAPWMVAIGLSAEGRRQIIDEVAALESDHG